MTSGQGRSVPDITSLMQVGDDYVREVIYELRLSSLVKWVTHRQPPTDVEVAFPVLASHAVIASTAAESAANIDGSHSHDTQPNCTANRGSRVTTVLRPTGKYSATTITATSTRRGR